MTKYLAAIVLLLSLTILGRLVLLSKQEYPRLVSAGMDVLNLVLELLLVIWALYLLIGAS